MITTNAELLELAENSVARAETHCSEQGNHEALVAIAAALTVIARADIMRCTS